MKRSKKSLILFGAFGLLILIQFVPVTRDNPPVTGEFDEHPEVMQVFQQSCYDCHSNTTVWPWYSHVAPASWILAGHVADGRKKLNFSNWTERSAKNRAHLREEIWGEVEEGAMPLSGYLMLHSDAVLSDADKTVIQKWSSEFVPEPTPADSVEVEYEDDGHAGHEH